MDAARPERESDVGPVVDDERNACHGARLNEWRADTEEIARLHVLLPQLNDIDTSVDEFRKEVDERTRLDARPGDEVAYYDKQTGERMEIVSELLPLSDSASALPRTPENLRICPHCEELVGADLSECPHCLRRLPALAEGS